jgi:hypothetical protein
LNDAVVVEDPVALAGRGGLEVDGSRRGVAEGGSVAEVVDVAVGAERPVAGGCVGPVVLCPLPVGSVEPVLIGGSVGMVDSDVVVGPMTDPAVGPAPASFTAATQAL